MKIISNFLYSLKQGFKGIFSNKTMSVISVISVSSALIILGIVISIVLNINKFIEITKDDINEIRVSIDNNLNESQIQKFEDNLGKIKGIKNIEYKSKEDAFDEMKKSWGDDSNLLEGVKNPLNDYYIITVDNADDINSISNKIDKIEGTESIEYYQDIINNFLNISNTVRKFGSILIVCLLIVCLVIISNTIKGRVYSKREEIQILKYVGASNNFIIAPFIVEGFIIGAVGSLLSIGVCISMYGYILEKVTTLLNNMFKDMIIPTEMIFLNLIGVLSLTGIIIGVLGSALSVKKHLKV